MMSSRMATRVVAVSMLAAVVVGGSATAGYALGVVRNWNSSGTPLKVAGYGSTGYGYGNWRVSTGSDGTKSRLAANIKLNNADNHTVYAQLETQTNAGYCFQPDYTSCNAQYYTYDTKDTNHYNGSAYKLHTQETGVNSSGNYARAIVYILLDVPYRTDPRSGGSYTAGDSY